jgi:hypothetical protein
LTQLLKFEHSSSVQNLLKSLAGTSIRRVHLTRRIPNAVASADQGKFMLRVNAERDQGRIGASASSNRRRRPLHATRAAGFTAALALLFIALPLGGQMAMKEVTTDKGAISIPLDPQHVVANYSVSLIKNSSFAKTAHARQAAGMTGAW